MYKPGPWAMHLITYGLMVWGEVKGKIVRNLLSSVGLIIIATVGTRKGLLLQSRQHLTRDLYLSIH